MPGINWHQMPTTHTGEDGVGTFKNLPAGTYIKDSYAHGDVHTLQTSTSGYLGGLSVRLLTGAHPDLYADVLLRYFELFRENDGNFSTTWKQIDRNGPYLPDIPKEAFVAAWFG